ncbi:MAG: hypothetical protein JWM44_2329 [Bacilli bacterium]|nr:hypothetical protein [Bacilli bacterium]
MNKKKIKFLCLGLLFIAFCIVLAFLRESAYLLFLASIVPLFIVPFIPDIRTNQHIKPSKGDNGIRIYQATTNGKQTSDQVVIEFKPGKIQWNKNLLLFSPVHIAKTLPKHIIPEVASLSVLKYDLMLKNGKIGIQLKHLIERSTSFSFTLNEVNRLILSIEDIKNLHAGMNMALGNTASKSKQLQA